uniref:Uncharacterized protein n=1 Tax=Glossina pallidipes TaxID=7398 RepID=A0A1A9Z9C8_GLOPL
MNWNVTAWAWATIEGRRKMRLLPLCSRKDLKTPSFVNSSMHLFHPRETASLLQDKDCKLNEITVTHKIQTSLSATVKALVLTHLYWFGFDAVIDGEFRADAAVAPTVV